jgi:hypothetical protein
VSVILPASCSVFLRSLWSRCWMWFLASLVPQVSLLAIQMVVRNDRLWLLLFPCRLRSCTLFNRTSFPGGTGRAHLGCCEEPRAEVRVTTRVAEMGHSPQLPLQGGDLAYRCPPRHRYPSNVIKTYKYSALTFAPKCLFEQFRRVANIYFLVISLLQARRPWCWNRHRGASRSLPRGGRRHDMILHKHHHQLDSTA